MFISIDIGGTNTRVASSINLKDIESVETFSSDKNIDSERKKINDAIKKLVKDREIEKVVVGIAAIVDRQKYDIIISANYPELNGVNVKNLIEIDEKKLKCINDAEAAALGEAVFGSGKSFERVAYLGIGTGVGGALVENKKLAPGLSIQEIGHHVINFDSDLTDGWGINGTFECFGSGTAFKKNYQMQPHECKDSKVWAEFGKYLGVGIRNISLFWNPQVVVIGGGMAKYYDLFLGGINEYLKSISFLPTPKIMPSELGPASGMVGGLVFLSQDSQSR